MPAIMLNIFIGVNMPPRTPKACLKGAIQKGEKMKRQKRNKKATASANAAAGSRLSPAWFEEVNAELLKLVNEAD